MASHQLPVMNAVLPTWATLGSSVADVWLAPRSSVVLRKIWKSFGACGASSPGFPAAVCGMDGALDRFCAVGDWARGGSAGRVWVGNPPGGGGVGLSEVGRAS